MMTRAPKRPTYGEIEFTHPTPLETVKARHVVEMVPNYN
jgi:hypothetical protein